MSSLDAFAKAKLDGLAHRRLRRELFETAREDGLWCRRGMRRYLSFSCNDYLGLSHHPKVKAAAVAAVERFGAGAGASRLVTGNHPLLAELESGLARFKGSEAAAVFGSGFLANAGVIPALVGEGDLVLLDALSHACLFAGARLSRAEVETFRHNDAAHLHEILASRRTRHSRVLVATESVFSMDGDLAPLDEIGSIARAHEAWLLVDDAHGSFVAQHRCKAAPPASFGAADLLVGTLSKALGSYGGYLCASKAVVDLIATRARTLVYSTALPPAAAAAALAALDIARNDPQLCAQPLAKARAFAAAAGLAPPQSAIVPLILGEPSRALRAQALLEDEGFLAVAIRPPTVPAGTARLRFAFSACHSDGDIARLAEIVRTRIVSAA